MVTFPTGHPKSSAPAAHDVAAETSPAGGGAMAYRAATMSEERAGWAGTMPELPTHPDGYSRWSAFPALISRIRLPSAARESVR